MDELTTAYVLDANVLIDYFKSDLSILTIFSKYLGQIYVPTDVLDKVQQISIDDCNRINLKIVEPTLEQYIQAGIKINGLAFDDRICFIIAKDNKWKCITNDKQVRATCERDGISVIWGLELMLPLVERKLITPSEALEVAKNIHESNPLFVNKQILSRFDDKIKKLTRKKKT